jgi:predicted transglutaminase-like cysteine proteinase
LTIGTGGEVGAPHPRDPISIQPIDCEDYVLLKRRMLMQAGWPREALLVTVVRDKKGDGHAVLNGQDRSRRIHSR